MLKQIETNTAYYYKLLYAPKGLGYLDLILNNEEYIKAFTKNRGAANVIFGGQNTTRGKQLYDKVVAKPEVYTELFNTWCKTQLGELAVKSNFIDTVNDAQSILNILEHNVLSKEFNKYNSTTQITHNNPILWNNICALDNKNIIKTYMEQATPSLRKICYDDVASTKIALFLCDLDYTTYDSSIELYNNTSLIDLLLKDNLALRSLTMSPSIVRSLIDDNLITVYNTSSNFKESLFNNEATTYDYMSDYITNYLSDVLYYSSNIDMIVNNSEYMNQITSDSALYTTFCSSAKALYEAIKIDSNRTIMQESPYVHSMYDTLRTTLKDATTLFKSTSFNYAIKSSSNNSDIYSGHEYVNGRYNVDRYADFTSYREPLISLINSGYGYDEPNYVYSLQTGQLIYSFSADSWSTVKYVIIGGFRHFMNDSYSQHWSLKIGLKGTNYDII